MTDPLLRLHTETVLPEWIDYNGHMNVAWYVLALTMPPTGCWTMSASVPPM